MNDENVVVLTDEEGKDVRFLHIMTFEFEESIFVALTPEEKMEGVENGEVLLMEVLEDEDGCDCYVPIEDEDKLDIVWEEFERLYYEDDDDYEDKGAQEEL
ncbi:MAG: DUF1292 domain-containing protein [Christensenellales bacterium]